MKTKKPTRINLVLPFDLAEKLYSIGREVGLDKTNTLRHLIAIYELKELQK